MQLTPQSSILNLPVDCVLLITQSFEAKSDLFQLACCCKYLYQCIFCGVWAKRGEECGRYFSKRLNDSESIKDLTSIFAASEFDVCSERLHLVVSHYCDGQAVLLEKIQQKFSNIELSIQNGQFPQTIQSFSVKELSFRGGSISKAVLDQVVTRCRSLERLSFYDCAIESYTALFEANYPSSMTELRLHLPLRGDNPEFESMLAKDYVQQEPLVEPANSFRYSLHGTLFLARLRNHNLGQAQGVLERTRKFLEKALEVNQQDVVALTALGILFVHESQRMISQNIARAHDLFEKALILNPEQALALTGMAIVLSRTEDEAQCGKAKDYLERACTLSKDSLIKKLISEELRQNPASPLAKSSLGSEFLNWNTPDYVQKALALNEQNLFLLFSKTQKAFIESRQEGKKTLQHMFEVNKNSPAMFSQGVIEKIAEKIANLSLPNKRLFCHPATFFGESSDDASEISHWIEQRL